MIPSLFVDTWGFIVLADQKDIVHQEVSSLYHAEKNRDVRMVTTDFVLDELITFLFAKKPSVLAEKYLKALMASIEQGFIQLERIAADRFEKAWNMRLKYGDHPAISFTDFTSFVVMQELKITRVLTNDRHFIKANLGFCKLP